MFLGLVFGFLHGLTCAALDLINELLDLVLVLQNDGSDNVVDGLGPTGLRCHQVDEEQYLEVEVQRDECEKEASELVKCGRDSEHDPVSQPLFVVFVVLVGLEGLDALYTRIYHCENHNKDIRAEEEHYQKGTHEQTHAQNQAWLHFDFVSKSHQMRALLCVFVQSHYVWVNDVHLIEVYGK